MRTNVPIYLANGHSIGDAVIVQRCALQHPNNTCHTRTQKQTRAHTHTHTRTHAHTHAHALRTQMHVRTHTHTQQPCWEHETYGGCDVTRVHLPGLAWLEPVRKCRVPQLQEPPEHWHRTYSFWGHGCGSFGSLNSDERKWVCC